MIGWFEFSCGTRREPCRDMPGRARQVVFVDGDDLPATLLDLVLEVVPFIRAQRFDEYLEYWEDDGSFFLELEDGVSRCGEVVATLRPYELPVVDRRQLEFEAVW